MARMESDHVIQGPDPRNMKEVSKLYSRDMLETRSWLKIPPIQVSAYSAFCSPIGELFLLIAHLETEIFDAPVCSLLSNRIANQKDADKSPFSIPISTFELFLYYLL